MELYVIVPIISFVGAGLGSFVAAYLKKKGENLATHEDIGRLVEQVAAVTKTTKEIEAKISDEVWGRQRLWEMKRDAFFALVKAQSKVADTLIILSAAFQVASKSHPESHGASNASTKAMESWWTASGDFEAAGAQVQLVCGPDVEKQLNSMITFLRATANQISEAGSTDFIPKLNKERNALLAAVRKDLAAGN